MLIDLSKQVITQHESDFNFQRESNAFLFDISMLFEYFIRKLIRRYGLHPLSKFEQKYKIPTGAFSGYTRKLIPDLVFESDGGLYVFDVKYKTFDTRFGVKREDLFQLHTYIGQYANSAAIKGCGFIFPISECKWHSSGLEQTSELKSAVIHQQGIEIPFHVIFLKIPDNASLNFNRLMSEQCRLFMVTLKSKVLTK